MKVVVLGAGYVGKALASTLLKEGHAPVLTTRSSRMLSIPSDGSYTEIQSIAVDVTQPHTFQSLPKSFDALVYLVSAGERSLEGYRRAYYEGVASLVDFVNSERKSCETFCYVSSTGVFSENEGGIVDENSQLVDSGPSSWIVKGEEVVSEQFKKCSLVLRFSGIYGPGREYLVRKALSLPDSYLEEGVHWTNRIHRDDGAGAILYLLKKDCGGTFIVSDSEPLSRLDVYNFIRTQKNLKVLEYASKDPVSGKRCSNRRLIETGYDFIYPHATAGYLELLKNID